MLERRFSDEGKHYGFFTGLYKRNEMFLIASAFIFFASIFAGYFLSGMMDHFLSGTLKSLKEGVNNGQIKLTTLSIFANNIKIAFLIYGGGIVFGLVSLFYLVFNGLFIGYAASKYVIGDFILYTLPHGVFEIAGIIIAGAAGFRIASCIIHIISDMAHMKKYMPLVDQMGQILNVNYGEFKESLILFIIAAVLIFIAAIIEANFTIAWASYVKGII
ncbi:stage II sporulation protein M [Methanobacterium sp.]|uniref:stage II sporulation protein M n=1 Tax=Methanobacterium sp. TaxID=2164 RepID=UPI003C759967